MQLPLFQYVVTCDSYFVPVIVIVYWTGIAAVIVNYGSPSAVCYLIGGVYAY
jgi:hypothetical protein